MRSVIVNIENASGTYNPGVISAIEKALNVSISRGRKKVKPPKKR